MDTKNTQQNHTSTIPPELELRLQKKEEKNPFVSACNLPAVEYKIQQLLNINPKTWHDLKDKGIIPIDGTYGECLQAVFTHYRNKNDAATIKAQLHSAKNGLSGGELTESGLPRLLEAEKVQKIRLDKAKEQEIHLRNLSARGEMLDKDQLYALTAPLIGNIANILRNAADENPDLQEIVDKCFNSLFALGERLVEQANEDKLNYVQHMLDTPLDLDSIIDGEVKA